MSRGSYRFGRALNATFVGTGNVLGGAADFFLGSGFGNSFRAAGQLTGLAAGAIGRAGWTGAEMAARGARDRRSRSTADAVADALVSGNFAWVLTTADGLLGRGSREPAVHAWRVLALTGLGRYDEAARAADLTAQQGLPAAEVDRLRAGVATSAGHDDEAVEHFTRLAAHPGYRCEALTGRAAALVRLHRPDEAVRDATVALATAEDAETYFVRALARKATGELVACLGDLDEAKRLCPFVSSVLEQRVEVLELLHRAGDAEPDRRVLAAMDLLVYLERSGVLIARSPNGHNIELRGASVGPATMSRIAAVKPELLALLEMIEST